MKKLALLFSLIFLSCTAKTRSDWDSGAQAQRNFQEQQRQEQMENVRNQFPSTQPF